ncbi:MAG: hypothetical protein ABR865_03200 [Terracidiphilus sp.]|jgi:hypothetical protein
MRVREALSIFTGVAMVALAAAAMGAQGPGAAGENPDVIEVRNYVLTLAKAEKTATAMQSINQLVAANPSLNAALDAGSATTGKKPITQQAQDIDAQYPQIAAIIHANGLETREFIVITGAIINDVGFVGMKMQGMITAYPPNSVTPANAAFVEANWAAFQAIAAKMTPPNSN